VLRDSWLREFQLWELSLQDDRTAILVCSRDSEDKAFSIYIEYTTFHLDYPVKPYVEGGVLLLPSEHWQVIKPSPCARAFCFEGMPGPNNLS
jgi:hypothetical protein